MGRNERPSGYAWVVQAAGHICVAFHALVLQVVPRYMRCVLASGKGPW